MRKVVENDVFLRLREGLAPRAVRGLEPPGPVG